MTIGPSCTDCGWLPIAKIPRNTATAVRPISRLRQRAIRSQKNCGSLLCIFYPSKKTASLLWIGGDEVGVNYVVDERDHAAWHRECETLRIHRYYICLTRSQAVECVIAERTGCRHKR